MSHLFKNRWAVVFTYSHLFTLLLMFSFCSARGEARPVKNDQKYSSSNKKSKDKDSKKKNRSKHRVNIEVSPLEGFSTWNFQSERHLKIVILTEFNFRIGDRYSLGLEAGVGGPHYPNGSTGNTGNLNVTVGLNAYVYLIKAFEGLFVKANLMKSALGSYHYSGEIRDMDQLEFGFYLGYKWNFEAGLTFALGWGRRRVSTVFDSDFEIGPFESEGRTGEYWASNLLFNLGVAF